jgi:oligosaccharide repeat unit polymerase
MILSTLRLSGLQNSEWGADSIAMLWGSTVVWGVIPFIFLLLNLNANSKQILIEPNKQSKIFRIIRYISVIFIVAFFAENKLLFGNFVPILGNLSIMLESHSSSIPLIGILTKGSAAVCVILMRNFIVYRKRIDLLIFFVCILLPVTRGSRIDILLSIISTVCLMAGYNFLKFSRKSIYKTLIIIFASYLVFIILGNYRTTHGGEYEVSVKELIEFKQSAGPGEIHAWYYTYFCMPFEDFDRITTHYSNVKFNGVISFSPIINGIFLGNTLFDIPNPDVIYDYNYYFTNPFAVPTALAYFYMDLGVYGGLFMMMIYMFILLFLYRKSRKNEKYLIIYSLFMGAFALSSFQAVIVGAETLRMIIIAILPFILTNNRKINKAETLIN